MSKKDEKGNWKEVTKEELDSHIKEKARKKDEPKYVETKPGKKPQTKAEREAGLNNIKDHQWKPGQSGNPNGRPKGSKSIKSLLAKYLNDPNAPLDDESRKALKGFLTPYEGIALKLISKALQGDLSSTKEILDRYEGRLVETQAHATLGKNGKLVGINSSNAFDLSKLTDDELRNFKTLSQKATKVKEAEDIGDEENE